MSNNSNIFKNKKILIYGLGKSGISTFNFLKKYNEVFLFDDYQKKNLPSNIKKNIVGLSSWNSSPHLPSNQMRSQFMESIRVEMTCSLADLFGRYRIALILITPA